MRNLLIIFVIFLNMQSSAANDPEITDIRQKFYELTLNSADTKEVLEEVRALTEKSGIILAYEAALQALMAKVAWNPFSKIGHVKLSQKIFDLAVAKDPSNVEIRFIRFSVEYHIPKWLGLSKNMQTDKDHILNNISAFDTSCISNDMLNYIEKFVIECGWFSNEDLVKVSEVTGA